MSWRKILIFPHCVLIRLPMSVFTVLNEQTSNIVRHIIRFAELLIDQNGNQTQILFLISNERTSHIVWPINSRVGNTAFSWQWNMKISYLYISSNNLHLCWHMLVRSKLWLRWYYELCFCAEPSTLFAPILSQLRNMSKVEFR